MVFSYQAAYTLRTFVTNECPVLGQASQLGISLGPPASLGGSLASALYAALGETAAALVMGSY